MVLYITYDGLTDPLGASQIIPYLKGISSHQNGLIVLSFEKLERMGPNYDTVKSDIELYGIRWFPVRFTNRLGAFGKMWDLIKMYVIASFLSYKYKVRIVHARGHLSAQVAYFVKRILNTKLLFDFRGLWVDERVDKGGWDLNFLPHYLQYKYFKRVERKLLAQSDQVVVLTQRVVDEVVKLGVSSISKVTVIPCCADFNHFSLSSDTSKAKIKEAIGIPKESFVLGYLGSVGSMYLLDKTLLFFKMVLGKRVDAYILFITNDTSKMQNLIIKNLPKDLHSSICIKSANRNEVPLLIPIMDIMVSFIAPSYARMAASPTKIAECFAAGIPVISNDGIGDVDKIVNRLDAGEIVNSFSDENLIKLSSKLDKISKKGGRRLRDVSRPVLGLELANKRYKSVYENNNMRSCL